MLGQCFHPASKWLDSAVVWFWWAPLDFTSHASKAQQLGRCVRNTALQDGAQGFDAARCLWSLHSYLLIFLAPLQAARMATMSGFQRRYKRKRAR